MNIFIKPAVSGAHVPDPHTHRGLKAEGEWKPATEYWLRRLSQGDVVEAEPPVSTPTPNPSPQGGGEPREPSGDRSARLRGG